MNRQSVVGRGKQGNACPTAIDDTCIDRPIEDLRQMDALAERLKNMTPLQRAVFALKETQARLETLERKRTEPIAIVGMACRFPGGIGDPASYWRLVCEKVDAIGEIPADRWNVDEFYDPDPAAPGKMSTRWGGFLERIDEFDNHFFNISDREAERIDPQQRILLELAWEALEDAGLPPSKLRGTKMGVFIGISLSEYGLMLSSDLTLTDAHAAAGTSLCLAANRLSFAFGLHGPSMALDTACSSSLVALHLACQHLRNSECDSALVGGTNLLLSPLGTVNLTKAGFCASDGRVRAFDAGATGYVRSEGAGIVVLKPLEAAVRNRDRIYAVIRGSAVNQNGSSNGVTAPSRAAQEQVLREAYARAQVSPGVVQYVETQGTGTPLGDAIEATALGNVLREGRPAGSRCAIGSVKTNIGHLEAASGIASLMKASLALKHRQLPPSLHFEKPNPDIPFDTLPLEVQRSLEPWPDDNHPRFAGVSAFGFGGSNSHVVLEEAPASQDSDKGNSPIFVDHGCGPTCRSVPVPAKIGTVPRMRLLPISARTENALHDLAQRYADFLRNDPPDWADVCYTASCGRDHHDCRLAVAADSHQQAIEALTVFLNGQSSEAVFAGRKSYGRGLKIAFVYDDQIENWTPFRSELANGVPGLGAAMEDIDAALRRIAGWSWAEMLADEERWNDPASARPALLALQLTLTAWWRRAGIAPDVVMGRGVGELAAASAAGILTTEEALQLALSGGHGAVKARSASLPFVSAVDGKPHAGHDLDAFHWQACLAQPHALAAAAKSLDHRNVDICLEIGPQSLAPSLSLSSDGHHPTCTVPSLQPKANQRGVDVLSAVGTLYAAGADILWESLLSENGGCVRLPTYPWQRQRLWLSSKNWLMGASVAKPSPDGTAPEAVIIQEIRTRPDLTVPYVSPRTKLEEALAGSWSLVLKVDRVGVHDNFLELGGDSLQATILLNRLQEQLGEAVPAHMLFHTQTIDDLAAYLREHYGAAVQRRHPGEEVADGQPRDGTLSADGRPSNGNGHAPVPAASIPRVARDVDAEQLLERLDELSDEEVESLLGGANAPSEANDE